MQNRAVCLNEKVQKSYQNNPNLPYGLESLIQGV